VRCNAVALGSLHLLSGLRLDGVLVSDVKNYLSHGILSKYIDRANSVELCSIECHLNRAETAMKADPKTPPAWWGLLDKYKLKEKSR
jgi:hypothetical protein